MTPDSVSRTNALKNRFWTCQRSGATPSRAASGQEQLRPRSDLGQVGVGPDLFERACASDSASVFSSSPRSG